MSNIRSYDFHLPLWKQGDDFADSLSNADDDVLKGIDLYVLRLQAAIDELNELREKLEPIIESVEMDGDTHCIWVIGPTELLGPLAEGEEPLLTLNDFEDDEDYDDGLDEE